MSNATIAICAKNTDVSRYTIYHRRDSKFDFWGTCKKGWEPRQVEFKKLFEGFEDQSHPDFLSKGLDFTPSAIKEAQIQVGEMRPRLDQLKTDIEQLSDSHKLLERPVVGVAPRSPDVSSLAQDFCIGLAIVMSFYV